MLHNHTHLIRSEVLTIPGVVHGFSTRLGGVSTLPHTAAMNIAEGHGDPAETVRRNIDVLVSGVSDGRLGGECAVVTHQIHSDRVRIVTEKNRGEGVIAPAGEPCDGFATDRPGVVPIVRTADCVPILMFARKPDGSPAVCALHAGWRGTAAAIACRGVDALLSLGGELSSVRAAIGPHIGACCFEVGEDMYSSVCDLCGAEFASRHIRSEGGRLKADLTGMNLELLLSIGVREDMIDLSEECTCCRPDRFHSHRATHGVRGAMGSCIAIL